MSFELRTSGTVPGQDIPVAEVSGEVDAASAAGFEAALAGLAVPALVVDLSQASYLDSAGFAVLDRLLAKAALAVVVSPGSVLRTAAELMSIPIHDTVEQPGPSCGPDDDDRASPAYEDASRATSESLVSLPRR